jgi:hypothetical protein
MPLLLWLWDAKLHENFQFTHRQGKIEIFPCKFVHHTITFTEKTIKKSYCVLKVAFANLQTKRQSKISP